MEIRRAATDLVLRASNSHAVSLYPPICSLVSLRTPSLQTPRRPLVRLQASATRCSFSSTRPRAEQGPAAARKEEEDESDAPPRAQAQQPDGPRIRRLDRPAYNPRNKVAGTSESLKFLRPLRIPNQQQQDHPQPGPSSSSSSSSSTPNLRPSSLDEFLATFKPRTPAPDTLAPTPSNNRSDTSRMIQPSRYAHERPAPRLDALALTARAAADLAPSPVRLGPRLGRTVVVNARRNIDVAAAFRTVEMRCGQNRVKADLRTQKFHERPGMRRKRLARQRWRKRFKMMFVQTVARVEALKRQGW